jgi:anti-sigma regulatory factor (Ser/Thr protein kinase)
VTSLEITIASRLAELARVSGLIDELAQAGRLPPPVVADLQVAVDEILANIVEHGYPDGGVHQIRVRLTADRHRVQVEIEDDGRPFDPAAAPPPDRTSPLHARRPGGLGLHFVRSLMTEARYTSGGGKNRLVLTRDLTDVREAAGSGDP